MKRNIPLFIFLFLLTAASNAQEIVVGYTLGYGNYQMRDMKKIQTQSLNDINALYHDVKNVEDFPGWIFQNLYAGYKFGTSEVGLQYNHYATSGRNHLADYSGEYINDMHVKGNAFGVYYKIYFLNVPIKETFRFDMNFSITGGFILNKYKSEASLEIYNQPSLNTYSSEEHNSTNIYFLPVFMPQIWYKDYVGLFVNIGYQVDVQGHLFYGKTGSSVGVNWTGLRLGVGLSGKIPLKKKR